MDHEYPIKSIQIGTLVRQLQQMKDSQQVGGQTLPLWTMKWQGWQPTSLCWPPGGPGRPQGDTKQSLAIFVRPDAQEERKYSAFPGDGEVMVGIQVLPPPPPSSLYHVLLPGRGP